VDRTRLTVLLALLGVIGVGVVALIISLVVPYNVAFGALLLDARGEGTYTRQGQPPAPLPTETTLALPVGSTVRLGPKSHATLTMELNGARVQLTGPATWTLVDAYRRATSLGHMLENARFAREYVLVLRQTEGTAYYDFSGSKPLFDQVQITVELPETRYTPTRPCWEITVQPDGSAQAASVRCR